MSKKSRKSQSAVVAAPVLVSDVPVAETQVEVVAVAEIAAPEAAPAEVVSDAPDTSVAPAAPVSKGAVRKYPRQGGKCWQVWNACDELAATGVYVTVKHAREIAQQNAWNLSNASQEFYAWKKFRAIA